MDSVPFHQGNSIFRNQPPFTLFNKTFEEAKDVLFQQIEEINPIFLTEAQLRNNAGLSHKLLLDPRSKKEQTVIQYDHSIKGKKQKPFKGGGIKSALTKEQHKIGLRVLLAQQQRQKLEEPDTIAWHKCQTKLQKERQQMHEFIRDFEEAHKEDIYAPTKRFDELYKDWFSKQRKLYAKSYSDNLAFNTHTGLPLVSLCKTINDDPIVITDVELLSKRGHVRFYREDWQVDWQNLNFRLHDYASNENPLRALKDMELAAAIDAELVRTDEKSTNGSFYIPLKTLSFLLTTGEVDLPTEVLLEIKYANNVPNGKVISFNNPLPARNCGYHTQQQVAEHCFAAFMSKKGRAQWLILNGDEVKIEPEEKHEVQVGDFKLEQYKPTKIEEYLAKNEPHLKSLDQELVKHNTALVKWYLRNPDADNSLKLLTTLSLPPATNENADKFLSCEFIKLESKPQFGCELFTKHELLSAWLQMRLMGYVGSTDHGICYHLATKDLSLQLKQRITIQDIELSLMQQYRLNPNQLLSNLAEFLKLLNNMPVGKHMLRYTPKYADKFLLCVTSKEIAQSTVFLHGLLQTEPTNLAWMTQQSFMPISETLCSAVHLDNKILPCAFLPQLPGQKHLEPADIKMNRRKNFFAKITSKKEDKLKAEQSKARKKAQKKRHRQIVRSKKLEKAKEAATEANAEEDLCKF